MLSKIEETIPVYYLSVNSESFLKKKSRWYPPLNKDIFMSNRPFKNNSLSLIEKQYLKTMGSYKYDITLFLAFTNLWYFNIHRYDLPYGSCHLFTGIKDYAI